ncbi:MAG: hypothetical protein HFE82_09540 [Erysipelotrichaceae bacterium]|nr:hypothetical protein [Erysipelotrichaceae bacterium]
MRKTREFQMDQEVICVSRDKLPQLLGCGQSTADKIAMDAGARIKVGKRVLIKLDKLREYLEKNIE